MRCGGYRPQFTGTSLHSKNIMRSFHLVCLVVLSAGRATAGQFAPRGPAAQVRALEDTLNAAWLRHDTLSLGRLIGADFHGITADGGSVARADMLRAAAHTEESATEYTDRTARAFGDVVVTTGRITDRGQRTTGEPFTVVTLVTFVWARRPSGWQLVAWHESFAPPQAIPLSQFRELRWLIGRWKGSGRWSRAFYEQYRFRDDSTIAMTAYTDSTFLSETADSSVIEWRSGQVRSRTPRLTHEAIEFAPGRIRFRRVGEAGGGYRFTSLSQDEWTATIFPRGTGTDTTVFSMRRVPKPRR